MRIRVALFVLSIVLQFSCKEKSTEKPKAAPPESIVQVATWEPVLASDNSKPVQRHEAAFVRVGTKFYLMGGRDVRPVSIYDTKTKRWSTGAEPPLELHHFQPVVFEEKIYVLGAFTGRWPKETPTTHVYIYDPALDSWSKGEAIPEARRRGAAGTVLYDQQVYVVCGIKNGHIGDHKNWLDRYDPKTGTWETLADAPRTRDHFQAVLADGKIYATAGRNTGKDPEDPFGSTIAAADVYDIKANEWSTLPTTIPTQRAGNAAVLFEGAVVVIGGESSSQEKAHTEVEALNLKTNKWSALPSLLEGRHGTGVIFWNNAMFVASGCGNRGGEPELFTTEVFGN